MPKEYDFYLNVVLGRASSDFFVIKRPYVDKFIETVGDWYDVYIFTAGVKEYADPLITKLDKKGKVKGRFFRDSCAVRKDPNTGVDCFIKDLSKIRMDPSQSIIIDNQPVSYSLNKESAIPIDHFFDDMSDDALLHLIPFLDLLRHVQDVRSILGLRILQLADRPKA